MGRRDDESGLIFLPVGVLTPLGRLLISKPAVSTPLGRVL